LSKPPFLLSVNALLDYLTGALAGLAPSAVRRR